MKYYSFLTVDLPNITRHPESKSAATGESTTFVVEATGDKLHFQWQKNCQNLPDGNRYYDTTKDTLRIVKVEKSDRAHYRCSVKNDKGEKLSNEAALTVSKLIL